MHELRPCMYQCLIMLKELAQGPPSILHFTLQMGRLLASDNLLCFFLYEKIIKAEMRLAEFLKIITKEAKERSQLRWR